MLQRMSFILASFLCFFQNPVFAEDATWQELNKEAINAMRQNQFEQAETLFKKALDRYQPDRSLGDMTIKTNLAVLYRKTGRDAEANELDGSSKPQSSAQVQSSYPATLKRLKNDAFTPLEPLDPLQANPLIDWCRGRVQQAVYSRGMGVSITHVGMGSAFRLPPDRILVTFSCDGVCGSGKASGSVSLKIAQRKSDYVIVDSSINMLPVEAPRIKQRDAYIENTPQNSTNANAEALSIRQKEDAELARLHERQKQNANSGYMTRYSH